MVMHLTHVSDGFSTLPFLHRRPMLGRLDSASGCMLDKEAYMKPGALPSYENSRVMSLVSLVSLVRHEFTGDGHMDATES